VCFCVRKNKYDRIRKKNDRAVCESEREREREREREEREIDR
jgi:hypothetical protein